MKYLKIEYLKNHLFCTERTDWLEYGIRNRRKSHKQNRNWSKHGINSCWLICAWEKRADWVWKRYLRNKIKGIQHGQKRFWNPKSSLHFPTSPAIILPSFPFNRKACRHEQITRPHRHRRFAFRLPAIGQQPIRRHACGQNSLRPCCGFFRRHISSCFRTCCRIGCAGCFCTASIRHSRGRHGQRGAVRQNPMRTRPPNLLRQIQHPPAPNRHRMAGCAAETAAI